MANAANPMKNPAVLNDQMERLFLILRDWSNWNARYSPRLGSIGRSSTIRGADSKSFDDLCDEAESNAFKSIDAAVDDLPPSNRAAINRCYGLCAVFRFPRENYEDCLSDAHARLLVSLKKKGVEF